MEIVIGKWADPEVLGKPWCALKVSGMNFDPDAFLNDTHLPKERILFTGPLFELSDEARKKIESGDPEISPDLPETRESFSQMRDQIIRLCDSQNLCIYLSNAGDLSTQIKEAIEFLVDHLSGLKAIRDYEGIEDSVLSFTTESEGSDFCDFPPEFYQLIDEIGIHTVLVGSLPLNCKPPSAA